MNNKDYKIIIPFLLFYTILTLFVLNNSFFWDSIQLGSEQAHWFYENNFKYLFLPERIDSGHPPSFGLYLAILWKIFGKSIAISHLAILPFLWGIVIQLYLILKKFIEEKFIVYALALLLADPTLLAQSTIVSSDIILVFFFLLSLNAVHSNKRILLSFALIGLGIVSMRGMMNAAAIFIIDFLYNIILTKKYKPKNIILQGLPYVPSTLITGGWLLMHYLVTGWIGYHENSPWKECFEVVGPSEVIKNIGILGWRLADFGRVFIWMLAIPVLYFSLKKKTFNSQSYKILVIFVVPFIIITPNLLIHYNLIGHRYLLILYLTFSLFIFYQVQLIWPKYVKPVTLLLIVGLITGNFWVYGDNIAKGWDSSLAHYPYYQLRKEMISYIENEKIDKQSVGSSFPNVTNVKYTDLSSDSWSFPDKDLNKQPYIFYSNVFNNFSDEELETLKSWKVVKTINSMTVKVILYQNPLQTGHSSLKNDSLKKEMN